jgi:hypothetical protein
MLSNLGNRERCYEREAFKVDLQAIAVLNTAKSGLRKEWEKKVSNTEG